CDVAREGRVVRVRRRLDPVRRVRRRGQAREPTVPVVILENGVIPTMDAPMPVASALAIAGSRVAGGFGTHETALASPDRVNLGGRCVLPGFSDAHVHFPSWSLAQREVRLADNAPP